MNLKLKFGEKPLKSTVNTDKKYNAYKILKLI